MRRHCARRDADGKTHTLAEDIRMASLEALLPEDLERHVHLSRARLATYEALRSEIVNDSEARGCVQIKSSPVSKPSKDPNAMDVDALHRVKGKGKPKGKGKNSKGAGAKGNKPKGEGGHEDLACYVCGKNGHLQNDCWWAASVPNTSKGKSEGKDKNTGKGKSKKEAAHFSTAEIEQDVSLLELSVFGKGQDSDDQPADMMSWWSVSVDTGAGASVLPESVPHMSCTWRDDFRRIGRRCAWSHWLWPGSQLQGMRHTRGDAPAVRRRDDRPRAHDALLRQRGLLVG